MFNVCKCDPPELPLTTPENILQSSVSAGHRPAPVQCTVYTGPANHNLARNAKLGSGHQACVVCGLSPLSVSVRLLHLLSGCCICLHLVIPEMHRLQ